MINNLINSRPPSFNQSLYNVATQCCVNRMRRKPECKLGFNSVACNYCACYIKKYIDPSMPQNYIDLFMLDAGNRAKIVNAHWVSPRRRVITTLVWLVLLGFAVFGVRTCITKRSILSNTLEQSPAKTYKHKDFPRVNRQIWDTLVQVKEDMERGIDHNNNGSVNCQDATLSFYLHYPERDKVLMIANYNMSHAYISIKIGRSYLFVEPQALLMNSTTTYEPGYIWGMEYGRSLRYDGFEILSYSQMMRHR